MSKWGDKKRFSNMLRVSFKVEGITFRGTIHHPHDTESFYCIALTEEEYKRLPSYKRHHDPPGGFFPEYWAWVKHDELKRTCRLHRKRTAENG